MANVWLPELGEGLWGGGADEQNTKEQEDSLKAERGKHACLAWEFEVQGSLQKYGFYEEDVMSMIFSL